jgi:hypothetical protein
MATGVTLTKLVKDLRAECGHSLAVAQGQANEETLRYLLARQQEELYYGYEWPFLKTERTLMTQAGQRYYDYPEDIPFDRVTQVWCHTQGVTDWRLLPKGINPGLFLSYDSEAGISSWPVQRWDHNADTVQMEFWPIPSQNNGEVRISGMKPLAPLLESDDICTLDSTLIVLFTSVEVLGRTSPQEGEVKNQKAQRHLQRVLGSQGSRKRAWTSLSGRSSTAPTPGLDYIPRGYPS